jgi:hypothetical protein
MPITIEELEKKFAETQNQVSVMKKDFDLKLESANKTAKEFQELAEKREEALRKFTQEAEANEKTRKEQAAAAHEAEIQAFVEDQVKAGRILPAFKEKITAFMKSLTSESTVMKFSEKDGSMRTHTQISLFKELIAKMKPVVPVSTEFSLAENAEIENPDGSDTPVEQFAEVLDKGQRKKLPIEGVDLAAKAYAYQEAQAKLGRSVGYDVALIAVSPKKSVAKA